MSQTPNGGDYFSSDTPPRDAYLPAEPAGSTQPYDEPGDPYAAPVDPYATPATDYAATGYTAPVEPYVTQSPTYVQPTEPAPSGTADVAKDEAANVKNTAVAEGQQVAGTAVDAGKQVAGTAKDEAKNVVAETGAQAKDLAKQAAGELQSQAGQQQQKIAGLVHSYAKELSDMASGQGPSGPLTDLVHQASSRVGEVGQWLEDREPRELLQDLSSFASRRPAVFLAGAALAGVLAGRLTRNLASEAKDHAAPSTPATSYSEPGYTPAPVTPTPVATGYPDQGGRYGDLASDDQVVSYGTVRTVGDDIR